MGTWQPSRVRVELQTKEYWLTVWNGCKTTISHLAYGGNYEKKPGELRLFPARYVCASRARQAEPARGLHAHRIAGSDRHCRHSGQLVVAGFSSGQSERSNYRLPQ